MDIRNTDTAIVFIDPQNDVLSETGASWGAVGARVTENRTIENMEKIFEAAKRNRYEVFISPHYFYPSDRGREAQLVRGFHFATLFLSVRQRLEDEWNTRS